MKKKALFMLATVAIVMSQACGTGTHKNTSDTTGTNGAAATAPPSVTDTSMNKDSTGRPDTGTKPPPQTPPTK
ncbi:MAG: hypothetical protein JO154_07135 [Chitinophaga sp.]|uniref:hypothetical protein n=1 Tax=Chitinophaga sp. TaxID=1869181 RepID=UPI0025C08F21|nr:hypothetical protein [Chitinophaga sp.]MBV8252366.1 hypothetical protein [Chitinophaga sp.]